ncbi:MAG TPA: response regulator [Nitrospiraceae bacterium]|nr:response regulator [Nitrospiraceae bacterium]
MASRQNGKRTCVMIVEQDWDFGIKLADWLASQGYQPVLTRTIDAAIGEFSSVRPQAIFVGFRSSDPQRQMNVGEVLLMIQTICPLMPIMAMADEANQVHTQIVFRQGVRRFLVKPVEFSQIGEVLQSELSVASV